jgi:hypothetical protein
VEPTTPTPEPVIEAAPDHSGEAQTVAFSTGLLPAMSQHCTRCGADLAADQRYCVVCGERRGEPRLPFMDGRTAARPAAVETVTTTTTAPPAPPRSRWSSGATQIAGVGTLLLALGVGVLIGNAGKDDNGSAAAAAPQVITVNGAAAAASDTTATTPTTADSAAAKDKAAKDAKSAKSAKSSDTTAKTATTVVTTPGGGSVPQATSAPVVKKGQKGSGPGYENGKFTGNFFGN